MDAIANEHRKTKEGNSGKYDYVDVRALERAGIPPYKMQDTNFIRIISPKFSKYPADKLPFYGKEIFIHTGIGPDGRTFVCPKRMLNQRCPICEYADTIRAQNANDDRLKELWPSRRYFFFIYNVQDAETEKLGLHWFDSPVSVKDNVISLSKDRRTGDFIDVSDPLTGKDIEFERVGKGMTTKYEGFKLMDNSPPPQEWYNNAPDDFEEFIMYPTYEQLVTAMGFADPSSNPQMENPQESVVQDPPTRTRGGAEQPAPVQQPVPVAQTVQDPPTRARGTADPQPQAAASGTAVSSQEAVRNRINQLRGMANGQ